MAEQKRSGAKQAVEEKVMNACKTMITFVLCAMNQSVRSELVVIDEGPSEQPEICEDLQAGRIAYSRTIPPVQRLKQVWYIKAHFSPESEQTVELLLGKYTWVDGVQILAQHRQGQWCWLGG